VVFITWNVLCLSAVLGRSLHKFIQLHILLTQATILAFRFQLHELTVLGATNDNFIRANEESFVALIVVYRPLFNCLLCKQLRCNSGVVMRTTYECMHIVCS
jgi:hypothetical protein